MVKISADGTVESVFEQFGETNGTAKKSSFNPVFDETPDIMQRVVDDARAPFAPGGMFDHSMDHAHSHEHASGDGSLCCGNDEI